MVIPGKTEGLPETHFLFRIIPCFRGCTNVHSWYFPVLPYPLPCVRSSKQANIAPSPSRRWTVSPGNTSVPSVSPPLWSSWPRHSPLSSYDVRGIHGWHDYLRVDDETGDSIRNFPLQPGKHAADWMCADWFGASSFIGWELGTLRSIQDRSKNSRPRLIRRLDLHSAPQRPWATATRA